MHIYRFFALVLLAALAAACGKGIEPPAMPIAGSSKLSSARVVVAVIDSGINMYHEFYYAGGPNYQAGPPNAVTQEVLDEFGIAADCILKLTRTGDFARDLSGDEARGEWAKIAGCPIVWFQGTNVLAASFKEGGLPILPDDEGDDVHGVGVSAAFINANSEAVLLFVEYDLSDSNRRQEAERFAFSHPAVDIVSTSYGLASVVPIVTDPNFQRGSFEGVYAGGKLFFSSCPNTPFVSPYESSCGPWWAIGVGGVDETAANEPAPGSNGRQVLSGNFTDFLADYTQTLPYCAFCESGQTDGISGNSFATPRAAGVTSRVLLEARRQLGHVGGILKKAEGLAPVLAEGVTPAGKPVSFTNWQMRRALEVAAWPVTLTDYDTAAPPNIGRPYVPVPAGAPWILTGWGVITDQPEHHFIDSALAHLGVNDSDVPAKDPGYCIFQTAVMAIRHAYWDQVATSSESFQHGNPDPIIPCI